MNFFDSKRSVVCAFAMVTLISTAMGLVIPDPSVEKASNSSVETNNETLVEHVDQPIERPVVVSEDLVGPYNNPGIINYCTVYAASYGFDDLPPCGYVRTSGGSREEVLAADIGANRGVVIFELDPTTCTVRNRQRFDTFGVPDDRVQLVEALESASAGTIIVGVSADSAETLDIAFRKSANWFFTKYNMNLSSLNLRYRDKFVFIMQKGYPKKTIYRSKPRHGQCFQTTFTLRGSTVSDVTFN